MIEVGKAVRVTSAVTAFDGMLGVVKEITVDTVAPVEVSFMMPDGDLVMPFYPEELERL